MKAIKQLIFNARAVLLSRSVRRNIYGGLSTSIKKIEPVDTIALAIEYLPN